MNEAKTKALAAALGQIEKQFGKGAVMRMGDQPREPIPAISTGSLNLDIALGIGGLPRGRIVEIYGPESSGKTTLTLSVIAQAQRSGLTCAFVDAEHALDPEYAGKLGVSVDDLLVSQPDTGEQALEITDMLVRSQAVDVIIVDSVAALVPKAEIEGEMGDTHVGLQARLMSQALRKITGNIKNANCLVIFINQIRMKIGVMFGSPETTTGGNALKFYASVRLDIRRTGAVKDGEEVIGSETRVKVVKNKVAPPFRQAEFNIIYGHGFDLHGELVELAVAHGLMEKSGAWYSYKGAKVGQGKANTAKYLAENPSVAQEIESTIRKKLLSPAAAQQKPELHVVSNEHRKDPVGSPAVHQSSELKSVPSVQVTAQPVIQDSAEEVDDEFDSYLSSLSSTQPSTSTNQIADNKIVSPVEPVLDASPLGASVTVSSGLNAVEAEALKKLQSGSTPIVSAKKIPSEMPEWYHKAFETGHLVQVGPWVQHEGKSIARGHISSLEAIEADPTLKQSIIKQ